MATRPLSTIFVTDHPDSVQSPAESAAAKRAADLAALNARGGSVDRRALIVAFLSRRLVKGEREHPTTARRSSRLRPVRIRRAWRLIPARAVPLGKVYPQGMRGGVMVPLLLRDGRKNSPPQWLVLEMKYVVGYGWYPVKHELDARETAALLGLALTTFFKISVEFESRRKIRGRVFFVTHELFEKDLRKIDDLAERHANKRGVRPGPHAEYCTDPKAPGPCPHADFCKADPRHRETCKDANDPRLTTIRRPAPSKGWTRGPRRPRSYTPRTPDAAPAPAPERSLAPEAPRQTLTEQSIDETFDPAARAAMYEEHRATIETERSAGLFVAVG